jgi:phage terminase large subunit-like protein
MAKEPRPKGYPKLKNYKPSKFMLPTSHYDKKKADRAVTFIENLCHTKGKWAGTPFWLLPWQEQLIRDIFGIVKPDGNRQFRTAFVEICKKVGKSELAAAIALYLLYADNEPSAEVYGAAADRQQASIVFDVAKQMVEMSPALMKRSKLMGATKRIVNYGNAGYYQVLSAEVGGKHGFSVSGLVFDEIHTQPNRQLYDVLTKGSSDARQNPLHFIITTAGNDRHSIAYELHTKAVDILEGRRVDPTFYPVVYGLKDDEDWEDEANWYKVNPSLGYTVDVERLRDAYREAKQNPADEITFKWLRCNMWVSSTVAWIPDAIYMRGNEPIDMASLEGRDCYAGLDLSSTGDITALVLIFPPRDEDEKFVLLPYFWIPEETIPKRVKANSVPYDIWEKQGYIMSTEGNVIHYDFIEKFIMDLSEKYHILEIAVDRWNATHVIQNLEDNGLTMVPFGQGFASMSAPTKEFYRLLMEGKIIHGSHPVMRWMAGNVVVDTDPAGNIKVTKAKSKEKIDGIVAAIMALDRAVRHESEGRSVYDTRGIILI